MDRPPALDTRARILRTALDLFAAHGYQRTSLQRIADRLGLTKAGILYHFPTKEHLLVALAEPLVSDLEASLARAAQLPWPAARWAALEGWLDTLLRHRRPLGTLYHDMTLLARGTTYLRIMRLAMQAYDLVAGPNPTRLERIRAIQATGMLGDPILFFADVPDDELRAELLDGASRLLGEPIPPPAHRDLPPPDAPRSVTAAPTTPAADDPADASYPAALPDPVDSAHPVVPPNPAARWGRVGAGPTEDAVPVPEVDPADVRPAGPEPSWPARRRRAGRPPALTGEQVRTARVMHATGLHTVEQIAARLGVSRATVYRHLRHTEPTGPRHNETVSDTN